MIRYAVRYYEESFGDKQWYMAEVPTIGSLTQGDSPEHIRYMARDLVATWLSSLVWGKEPGPLPPSDTTLPEGEEWEWVYLPVTVEMAINIRRLRDEAGLSQLEAAARIGVSGGTYQRWEDPRKCNARLETLEKIAAAYGKHFVGAFVA